MAKKRNDEADQGFIDEIEEASELHKAVPRKPFVWNKRVSGAPPEQADSTDKRIANMRKAPSGSSSFVSEQASKINKRRGR